MTKTIKKQHRTDGVFNSNNEAYAVPQTSRNAPLSDYKFTDLENVTFSCFKLLSDPNLENKGYITDVIEATNNPITKISNLYA